jgi:pyruvate,water dikinase
MKHKKNIVWFEEVFKDDVGLVGGKGANLGEMTNAHLPIPYGFIVTSNAYFNFVKEANLQEKIKQTLAIVNFDNPHELAQASTHAQELILKSEMPESLAKEIIEYYEEMPLKEEKYFNASVNMVKEGAKRLKSAFKPPLVAVRSSATAEDLPTASFAGQQETYLNVMGEAHLLTKVRECWASLFTQRAIYYRHQQGFDHFKVGLAAVIQRMVQSDKSGIAFSIDPVTNDKNKMVIEAIYGLGEYIVQGKVTPDHYEVDKRSFVLLKKEMKYQNLKYIKSGTKNIEVKLNKKEGSEPKLSDDEIIKIAILVKDIENHYYFPQDIEWAIEGDRAFIVQSRPITTMKETASHMASGATKATIEGNKPILTGAPASPGIAAGPVKIIFSPNEIDKVKKGDVLVAPQTNPDYVPAMKKACAIVTEKGGRTSHAAIVSRELGIPAVVGAEGATKVLKNEHVVSVNGETGEVFHGSILSGKNAVHATSKEAHHYKTLTKVYVNLAEPEQAAKVAKMDVDGIGLLRAEFMIAEIGVHPKEFIRQHKEKVFVNRLTRDLETFVKAFSPRQIVYRATDFKTNEYSHLVGGKQYEPKEENPMIGFRGASRYIANPDVFKMELDALKNIWNKGYSNLQLMIPFVRAPWELIKIKEMVREHGLLSLPGFKLWIMVEVPACALQLEEFLKVGVDGVSIGTNDLTMMLMGVDRDNQEVANIYDERNPVVIQVLEYIVNTCVEYGITCSICGQAASDYPELVEKLVKAGITSVSISPDAVDRTREQIYHIEKKQSESLSNKKK